MKYHISDIQIQPTDIIPLVIKAWKKSFARIEKNKIAIAIRGWWPFTRKLLLHPDIRATMTTKEIEEEKNFEELGHQVTPIIASQNQTFSHVTTHPYSISDISMPPLPPQECNFNFSHGVSKCFLTSFVAQSNIVAARETNMENIKLGQSQRETLKKIKGQFKSGALYKVGISRYGKIFSKN